MSHHGEDHASSDAGHAHPPPGLPEVKDEAGDTPSWVPKLGIFVVLGLVGLLVYAFAPLRAPANDAPAAAAETEAAK